MALLLLPAAVLLWLWMIRCPRPKPLPPCRRYAHRGLHDLAAGVPENSMAAFRAALAAGCGAELDVHLTADGRLAVLHDDDLRRLCGTDGRPEDRTAAELTALRILGTAETVPLLEPVLDLFEDGPPLLIELKASRGNGAALAAAVCRALEGRRVTVLLQSFHPLAVRAVGKLRPDLPRGQLSRNFLHDRVLPFPADLAMTHLLCCCVSRPDFIAYRFSDRRCRSLALIRRLWGTAAFYWTVSSPAEAAEADRAGAVSIFERFLP